MPIGSGAKFIPWIKIFLQDGARFLEYGKASSTLIAVLNETDMAQPPDHAFHVQVTGIKGRCQSSAMCGKTATNPRH
jgi:hypothetical protein